MTERQIRRREDILAAARKLITERGHDGVTMRDLAVESGVAPKTLYHQFGSKEKLLHAAVEERFRYLYQLIDEEEVNHGIDRLLFIIDSVTATTKKHLAYAKALAPMLREGSSETFTAIRLSTYRKAIDQIAQEGEFVDWVDVDLMTSIVFRQVNPIYLASWYEKVSSTVTNKVAKIDICLILASVTTGYSQKKALKTVREMQKTLKNTRLI